VRIISGLYKSKTINAPASLPVRPTTDFAKMGLFNILANQFDFEEVCVLDLFAGTGNITYEFLSRRAKHVYAVDIHEECYKFIFNTVNDLHFENVQVLRKDVFKFLDSCTKKFDIIFADPPYTLENKSEIVSLVFSNELLNPEGKLILEHSEKESMLHLPHFESTRKYGHVAFSFFS
jgi:16S rRNA (guanine(966)-N(2))-methyltransferase RsmD